MPRPLLALSCGLCFASAVFGGESATNRNSRNYAFEGYTGYRAFDGREYGLSAAAIVPADTYTATYGLTVHRIKTGQHAAFGTSADWEHEGYGLSGNYRQFLGNSLFLEGSLLAETLRAWKPANFNDLPPEAEVDYGTSKRVSITVQIGNQWQWEHFSFGITWIGRLIPVIKKANYPDHDSGSGSFYDFMNSSSNIGPRFALGWVI